MSKFLTDFILALVAIDPITLIPIFAAVTSKFNHKSIKKIALIATITSLSVLFTFYLIGNQLLLALSISISSFKIVGGIFLMAVSFEMVFEKRTKRRRSTANLAVDEMQLSGIAVFPMAIPMIAGPAAITLVLVKSSEENLSLINSLLNFFPIALVVIIAGFSMLTSGILSKYLNLTISLVLQRVFGLLLGALAIQFVIDGIKETFNIL